VGLKFEAAVRCWSDGILIRPTGIETEIWVFVTSDRKAAIPVCRSCAGELPGAHRVMGVEELAEVPARQQYWTLVKKVQEVVGTLEVVVGRRARELVRRSRPWHLEPGILEGGA